MMKPYVIDPKELENFSPLFRGSLGNMLSTMLMHFLSVDKVNHVYQNSFAHKGADFASGLLHDMGVQYAIGNHERLSQLPKGPFITISNHPYGGLDGIMTIDMMARIRPDYKFMVTNMLSRVKTLEDNFITVTSRTNQTDGQSAISLRGIRDTLEHLKKGHPVGFFPSGAVSDFNLKTFKIRDREWQKGILKLIYNAKVPIVPIRFFDHNSSFFYFLGLINWRIRSLRMPAELFNKKNKMLRIAIGETIREEKQKRFSNYEELGEYLRRMVYNMPLPGHFAPKNEIEWLNKAIVA